MTWIWTLPSSVNLTALLARLMRIWVRRPGSPRRVRGTLAAMRLRKSSPLFLAFRASMSATRSTTSQGSNSIRSSLSLPASILEKSRMSLMITSRLVALAVDHLAVVALVRRSVRYPA